MFGVVMTSAANNRYLGLSEDEVGLINNAIKTLNKDDNLEVGVTRFSDAITITVAYKKYVDWYVVLSYLQSFNKRIQRGIAKDNRYSFHIELV